MRKEEAFAEHYAAHYRQVRGFCRQLLGSTERGEDAAQEAFVRAYRAFATRDPAQPFIAWIMRIARNHCLDLLRRRSHEPALYGDETIETAAAEAPDADGLGTALTIERAAAVNAAVAKLPERYRVPLALAYYADADYDDIATTLGITRNHVGVLLCRAKQLLRKSLAESDTTDELRPASGVAVPAARGRAALPKETL
jgi:RNA polymerase sigma-70 factor (ECF subfamily)